MVDGRRVSDADEAQSAGFVFRGVGMGQEFKGVVTSLMLELRGGRIQ